MDPILSPDEQVVLRVLTDAADRNKPCPKNTALASSIGRQSSSTAVAILSRLERKGLIRVERFQSTRQVEILGSGRKTQRPAETTPHWLDKKRRAAR